MKNPTVSGTERLEQAVSAYVEALKEYTRERVPLDWAMTQNNLGNALEDLRGAGIGDGTSGAGGVGLCRGPQGVHPRARALGLGYDPEQPGQRP